MKTRPCHCCDGSGKEIDQSALGAELRSRRERLQISLNEVARRMKKSGAYLSDLERGNRHWNSRLIHEYESALK